MSLDSLLSSAIGAGGPNNDNNDNDDDDTTTTKTLKFIFVGGKGGVGKTTSSSGIAHLLARYCHKRVLLVSTDPAHSLSDAFRHDFTNVPICPNPMGDVPNLFVMEVDPSETMKVEMTKWTLLAEEVGGVGAGDGEGEEEEEFVTKIQGFQEWVSGIPGIDEATALSSALHHIESGEYDIIVFDTAPTGHTLKLLQMPSILETGIDKLQSWQSTLWNVYETFKSFRSGSVGGVAAKSKKRMTAKAEVASMLEEYKRQIQKVALMLQDQQRTRFVVVCIAEYLSILETQRLLQELKTNKVRASHVIVNQLVVKDALSETELQTLESMAEVGKLDMDMNLLRKTIHACKVTTSRKCIQEKYLKELKSMPETQDIMDGICEVPLLAQEITGNDALKNFSDLLITKPPDTTMQQSKEDMRIPRPLYESTTSDKNTTDAGTMWDPHIGDIIKICDLVQSSQYNGLEGQIVSDFDKRTERFGVQVYHQQEQKTLALQRKNMTLVTCTKSKKQRKTMMNNNDNEAVSPSPSSFASNSGNQDSSSSSSSVNNMMSSERSAIDKAKKVILDDPEIKTMIDSNPKFKAAVEDVIQNPMMNFMKYLSDPEMSPLLMKAMSKLKKA